MRAIVRYRIITIVSIVGFLSGAAMFITGLKSSADVDTAHRNSNNCIDTQNTICVGITRDCNLCKSFNTTCILNCTTVCNPDPCVAQMKVCDILTYKYDTITPNNDGSVALIIIGVVTAILSCGGMHVRIPQANHEFS